MVDPNPTQTMFYQPEWLILLLHNGLSTKMVDPTPTQIMVYQTKWLILLLHGQWFINQNG
jgi:hypothetical protein